MIEDVYASLRVRALQARLTERMKTSAQLQAGHMKKEGVPELALTLVDDAISSLRRVTNMFKRECRKLCKGEPVYDFVEKPTGLSTACFVFLGCLPPMTKFATVSKLWKYIGLFVTPGSRAPTRGDLSELKKEDSKKGWPPSLRADAIVRLAEPCVKMNGGEDKNGRALPYSPYRAVYDRRYLRTRLTHPPMLEEGEGCEWCDACYEARRKEDKPGLDCANMVIDGKRGHHWKPAHRCADAMRVTAKAIVLDLWLVENGKQAVVGGQRAVDTHRTVAPSAAIA